MLCSYSCLHLLVASDPRLPHRRNKPKKSVASIMYALYYSMTRFVSISHTADGLSNRLLPIEFASGSYQKLGDRDYVNLLLFV